MHSSPKILCKKKDNKEKIKKNTKKTKTYNKQEQISFYVKCESQW